MELFDPHSNSWLLTKFDLYKQMRERDTAYFSEKYKMYVITRYADVQYALHNHDIFSSSKGNLIVELPHRFGRTLGASDNPQHDWFKNIAKNAYTKDNIDRVVKVTSDYMRELFSERPLLNLSNAVDHISAMVSTEILGLPWNKDEIVRLIVDIQRRSPKAVMHNVDDTSYQKFLALTKELVETKRISASQPGLYKEYLENCPVGQGAMSLFTGPVLSGASSMTGALQFLVVDLYETGNLKSVIDDRNLIPAAINESLRYRASTGRFSRTVTAEVTLHGVHLKPGDRVALCLESANRDPLKFEDPDKFELSRNTSGHLAFGYGLHACIGMVISKAVMAVYLNTLLDTFGNYKVNTSPNDYQFVMTQSGNDDMISNLIIEKINDNI